MSLIDRSKLTYQQINSSFEFIPRYEIEQQPDVDPVEYAGGCYCCKCDYFAAVNAINENGGEIHDCKNPFGLRIPTLMSYCPYGRTKK